MSTAATDITNNTQPVRSLIDDDTFLKINAEYRLCKMLQREKEVYVKNAHRRFAYGLTASDFDSIIRKLVSMGFCSLTPGERGGEVITLIEHPSALMREICKPPVLKVDEEQNLSTYLTSTTAE